MNTEVRQKRNKSVPRKFIFVFLISFIIIMLAIMTQILYTVLSNDKIYKGVYINDVDVSDLPKSSAENLLKEKYQSKANNNTLVLKCNNVTEKINFSDLNVQFNISDAVEKAFQVGRNGNIFDKLYQIILANRNSKKIDLSVTFDHKNAENRITSLYNSTLICVKEADLLFQNDRVTIRSGHHGENIDKEKTLNLVKESIYASKDGIVEIPIIITSPSKINIDDYFRQINRDAKDVSFKVDNNKLIVVPDVAGRSIDKSSLIAIASALEKTENTEKVLPVVFTMPKITSENVSAKLFKDTLGTMSTYMPLTNQIEYNRKENIKLAVAKINNTILLPGQVFSFNNVVGPRTEEGGYKDAFIYSNGKVVPGVGGGICQVSSTLYNAALFSDFDVLERTNHMFIVSYVPFGRDAAVSYGQSDFKFKNTTKWPIRINGSITSDNRVYFSITGTNETPGKTIEINPRIVKTMDFQPQYTNDPSLAEGKTVVTHNGAKGYVVDTYKYVKSNGKVVNQTKISTSYYKPLNEEILRGTKKTKTEPVKSKPAVGKDDIHNPTSTPVKPTPTANILQ